MRLFLTFALFLAASACGTSEERPGRQNGPEPVPAIYVEPDQVPDVPLVPTLAVQLTGQRFEPCNLPYDGGVRELCMYDGERNTQIRAVHLPDEVGSPRDVLLKHAKAYHTQMAPELPFPTVAESADKLLATQSVRLQFDDMSVGMAYAYRKLPDLPGIVSVAVVTMTDGTVSLSDERFAEIERLAREIAVALKVEMLPAPATP